MYQRELIIDSFAGGGGASLGIEMATGRSPDIAINHDPEAVAMHRTNHPDTVHYCNNVWQVDPAITVAGRPVGLAWFSPDCKHHSKAKGGQPVQRNIRDLAWVVVLWAKKARPRVICLENVEEFADWGPLKMREDGKFLPDPERRGETFNEWTRALKREGYKVEWRELRACDYGAPTIRKRLFMIARRDGKPIVWPEPTHGRPDDPDVIAGRKLPWRTAAEIIDWSLPCPSIFLTREEGRALGVNRPLADATMQRISRGIKRYLIDAAQPFIVRVDQASAAGRNGVHSLDDPTRTIATAGGLAFVSPTLVGCGGRAGQSRPRGGDEPMATQTAKADTCIVAAHVTKFRNGAIGSAAEEPLHTITASSFIKRPGGAAPLGVVAAFLAQHNTDMVGHDARKPVSTIVQKGSTQAVVAAHMLNLKGSDRRSAAADEPLRAVTAGGYHHAEVRAFLTKYYGTGDGQDVADPLHSVTTKDRFGLVMIEGEPFEIVDIGMRMLQARELFRAQGFHDGYIIERGMFGGASKLEERSLTKTAQIRMCGNSVCPPMAAAIVRANFVEAEVAEEATA